MFFFQKYLLELSFGALGYKRLPILDIIRFFFPIIFIKKITFSMALRMVEIRHTWVDCHCIPK